MRSNILNKKWPFFQRASRTALAVFIPIFCGCVYSYAMADHPFLHGLDLNGFEQKGPLLIYNRNNIFEYMNGEAENYLPHGFVLLYLGTFLVRERDAQLIMEAYDMGSQKGAKAVFDIYARPPGQGLQGIGKAAWKSKSRFIFHRGPYFIRIASDPAAGPDLSPAPEELEALARETDRLLSK
jgi:hypothetical protein